MFDVIQTLIDSISDFGSYLSMFFRAIGGSLSTASNTFELISLVVPSSLVIIVSAYVFFAIVINVVRSVL